MPYKNKEERKKHDRANRERILAYQREWYRRHPEKYREYESHMNKEKRKAWQDDYREKNREHLYKKHREWVEKAYKKYRTELLVSLGGKCKRCGIKNFAVLQVHHKNGNQDIKMFGVNDYRYYRNLLTHLDDLELLCANCHILLHDAKNTLKSQKLTTSTSLYAKNSLLLLNE